MKKSIDMLIKIINEGSIKIKRERDPQLLADFSNGYAEGWYFCVPKFFYEALDIKFTERKEKNKKIKLWTQGSTFKFSTGDVIWNHAYPYCKNFVSEIIKPKIGIQVQSSEPCLPKTKDREQRYSGKVNFILFTERNDKDSKSIWKTLDYYSDISQDEFMEFLITGCSQKLDIDLNLGKFK
jgi:hypothetical protein